MSDTRRKHPRHAKDVKRVQRALSAGLKTSKQKRVNERAALRKEYR